MSAAPDRPLRVAYDTTVLGLDDGGTARAVREVRAALQVRDDVELVELAAPDGPRGRVLRGLRRELDWYPRRVAAAVVAAGADVLHCPAPLAPRSAPVPVVLTLNDAFAWDEPRWLGIAAVAHARLALGPAARRAAAIITPSAHARDRVVERLGVAAQRVTVVPYGVGATFTAGPAPMASSPYVLVVATLQPRKNVERVVAALDGLPSGVRLVVAGASGWKDDALRERLRQDPRVDLPGRVGEADLLTLYRGATVVAVPSLGEGYGFPVLEAMRVGVPVVVARAGALPEVAAGHATVVAPDDTAGWTAALRAAIERPDPAALDAARAHATARTWAACAQDVVAVYRAAIRRATPIAA